jgi:hypothetical protein
MPTPQLATSWIGRMLAIPFSFLLLWCSFLAVSVALLVLLRSRWGQGSPLQKCAVLSLLVHLVFACIAMTIRVVVGDGIGSQSGPPIRVRIIDGSLGSVAHAPEMTTALTNVEPPELLELPPRESNDAKLADASEQFAPAEPPSSETELPEELSIDSSQILPTPPTETVADAQPVDVTTQASPMLTPAAELAAIDPTNATDVVTGTLDFDPSRRVPTVAATPAAAYALRTAKGRLGLVEQQGGNVRTEAAVNAALAWLASAQSPDGHWDADHFGAGRELKTLGHDRGGAGRNADAGITALALLAFLGAGHSHQQGDFQSHVGRGLDYLMRIQSNDGSIFGDAEFYARMYCHSMAAFALAEAQAMTRDKGLSRHVRLAISYSLKAQNSATGGWRYKPGDAGDTSQLGWQMMALASAHRAGVDLPPQTWTAVERFLRSVRRGNAGGLASYRPDSSVTTPMTAEAFYCRLMLTEMSGIVFDERSSSEATAQLLAALPTRDRVNLYYWYYATLALHYRQQASDQAAAAWHAWNDALTAVLLANQVVEGPEAGSWNNDCLWGGYGGRVYTTAMATMCLEVYYRYAPSPPHQPWMATRIDMTEPSR